MITNRGEGDRKARMMNQRWTDRKGNELKRQHPLHVQTFSKASRDLAISLSFLEMREDLHAIPSVGDSQGASLAGGTVRMCVGQSARHGVAPAPRPSGPEKCRTAAPSAAETSPTFMW